MSHGYHSKNCKFPLSHFCRLFIGDSESESGENSVKEMVRQSSLEVIEDGARSWICFNKSVFKDNVKVCMHDKCSVVSFFDSECLSFSPRISP